MAVVIALDAGTTGVRTYVIGDDGLPRTSAYREFTQHFPRPGWVEHDADEIWAAVEATMIEATAGLDELTKAQHDRASERLTGLLASSFPDQEVEGHVRLGVPHIEILQLARELDVDLIVMATHGRGFLTHALLGSTAQRVVHLASVPVTLVK